MNCCHPYAFRAQVSSKPAPGAKLPPGIKPVPQSPIKTISIPTNVVLSKADKKKLEKLDKKVARIFYASNRAESGQCGAAPISSVSGCNLLSCMETCKAIPAVGQCVGDNCVCVNM